MKKLAIYFLLVSSLFASNLQVVSYVNPTQFSGLWYEIARTYNSYQKTCVASTVEYVIDEDQEYDVYNRCFDSIIGGELIEYSGSAKSAASEFNMAQLDMTYFWIFTKRYGVYFVDEEYTYALVADKDFEQLWIMSRTPTLDEQKLQKVLALLDTQIDTKRLIFTPQDQQGRYK